MTLISSKADMSIVDVAGIWTEMKHGSGDEWNGRCPLPDHDDSSPSFSVNEEKKVWVCRGCGFGGDVFDLVFEVEDLDYRESMTFLTERLQYDFSPMSRGKRGPNLGPPMRALEDAAKLYHRNLTHGTGLETFFPQQITEAADAIYARGLGSSSILFWKIGYAPTDSNSLTPALLKLGHSQETLVKAGLTKRVAGTGTQDFFRGRIIVPICNYRGKVVGFTARDLKGTAKAKWLNSPDTDVFNKSELLLGLHLVKKQEKVCIVEGAFDVMKMEQAKLLSVAANGTAFKASHADLLVKRGVKEVTLVYDGDDAGREAAVKTGQLLLNYDLSLYVASLPDGVDPGDATTGVLTNAMNSVVSFIQYVIERDPPRDFQQKHRMLQRIVNMIDTVDDDLKKQILMKEAMSILDLEDIEMPAPARKAVTATIKKPDHHLSRIEREIVWALHNRPNDEAVQEIALAITATGREKFSPLGRRLLGVLSTKPRIEVPQDLEHIWEAISHIRMSSPNMPQLLAKTIRWLAHKEIEYGLQTRIQQDEGSLTDYADAARDRLRSRS